MKLVGSTPIFVLFDGLYAYHTSHRLSPEPLSLPRFLRLSSLSKFIRAMSESGYPKSSANMATYHKTSPSSLARSSLLVSPSLIHFLILSPTSPASLNKPRVG